VGKEISSVAESGSFNEVIYLVKRKILELQNTKLVGPAHSP
jgi:hypothetical protein